MTSSKVKVKYTPKVNKKKIKNSKMTRNKKAPKQEPVQEPQIDSNLTAEMETYTKILYSLGVNDVIIDNSIEERDQLEVQAEERAILGNKYEEVQYSDPRPEANRPLDDVSVKNLNSNTEPCVPNYGVLSEVAKAAGIQEDAFNKVMDLFFKVNILNAGDVAEYNIAIRRFINEQKEKQNRKLRMEAEEKERKQREEDLKNSRIAAIAPKLDILKTALRDAYETGDISSIEDIVNSLKQDDSEYHQSIMSRND